MKKLSIDYQRAAIFIVVCVCVTILLALGKLDQSYLKYLLLWLIPSPIEKVPGLRGDKDVES